MEKEVLYELKTLQIQIMRKFWQSKDKWEPKSALQLKIVKYLIENSNDVVYQKDLENITHIRKSTLSGILDTMEKKNMIKRINSLDDARRRQIVLTDEMVEKQKEFERYLNQVNKKLTEGIPKEKLETFYEVVNIMKNNVDGNDL